MSTAVAVSSVEVPASRPDGGTINLQDQIIPDNPEHLEFLESNVWALIEKQIDFLSLHLKLSFLLPGDRQLERRARKLAWHLSKGRLVRCDWDNVSLSELTPAESRMPDDEFLALYPDEVKTPTKKGGRPRKYRSTAARRKGHAERQRRYREQKLVTISDVTKTPSQVTEK